MCIRDRTLGIDPIQFGVIMSVNLAIGLCSPPYGCNLFVGAAVAKIKMESMFKWIVPYFILSIIALMLITFVEMCIRDRPWRALLRADSSVPGLLTQLITTSK